ncbi:MULTISPECIES: TRAP transporter large permease [Desulfobacula]|uniref:DctM7: predicted TRAP dicarboxylate transport system permease n=2 Tax=Desulfobacula TaxID=28222 RepID=K0NFM9_DESTT|nr:MULTISPECIES: TRAP transporter large permease [Desulfobacula]CCK79936.1 DctM7: predicted TRAP dicarboxylate transport system permease [Desulfobacula toluolica Tol2]SDU18795.1 TRAP transporter, DctM subunit [Desulfobacula phenolica]
MDPTLTGVLGIVVLLIFILSGLHVGLVLILVGGLGSVVLLGIQGGLNILGTTPFAVASAYDLTPLPLFLLMGALAANGGLGAIAYDAMVKWIGTVRGGLAIASTFGSAFFGLACGSSLAATGVFTKVALPEMLKRNYNKELAIGSIAAAGTFSTMMPPSGLLIIYAIFTEESIGQLFMAGIIPGIITAVSYAVLIYFRVRRNPDLAPITTERFDRRTKLISLAQTWPIFFLVGLVLGGIFAGWFTATEAGGIGAFGALIIVFIYKGFRGANLLGALMDCMRTNGMIFLVIIGAIVFGRFLSVTQIPVNLATYLSELTIPMPMILLGFLIMYFVLGMFLDAVAILCITLPVVFPVIVHLGFNPIWFAIIVIKVTEIGLVTPPVGMNVYVAASAAEGQVSLTDVFKGIAPFIFCDIFILALLIAFPQIALFLPGLMF